MPFTAVGIDLGIGSAFTGALGGGAFASAVTPFITGGLEGAGLSAGLDLVTGKPLTAESILPGAITGGATAGFGPVIGSATGLGTTAGDVIAGLGSGALASEVTGGNPLSGAVQGGVGGLVSGELDNIGGGGSTTAATPTTSTATGGTGAGGATALGAPAALASSPTDLTSQVASAGISDVPSGGGTAISGGGGTGGSLSGAAPGGNIVSDVSSAGVVPATAAPSPGGLYGSDWLSPNQLAAGWQSANAGGTFGGNNVLSDVGGALGKYWPVLAGGGILGYEALKGNQPLPSQANLTNLAGQNASSAQALESYQQTGLLPPGLQSVVDAQTKAAQAHIRSTYANLGLSGSTSEAQALAGTQQQTSATIGKIASDLATQGIQLSQLSSQELTALMQTEQQQQSQLNNALASFASGLAGAGIKAAA